MTREEIRGRVTDEQALTATVYGEAAGEPVEGIIAVACVIRNRATAKPAHWWGRGYRGVCLAPSQFSCWWEDNANATRVYALAEQLILAGPQGERSVVSEIRWIAAGVIAEQLRDVTRNSDHYLTARLFGGPDCPKWAAGRVPTTRIGGHAFFRLEL